MKNNNNIIITAIVAVGIGLGIGYFLFGKKSEAETHVHPTASTSDAVEASSIYTCSMHPQVRQNEPGICPICEMDLIPLEANTSNDPLVLQMTKESAKLANIQTVTIGNSTEKEGKTIRLSGKVKPDERLSSSLVAHVPGRIEKLYVTFTGEQVSQGQKLADLYSPELITAQRELLEALKLQELNPKLLEAARNKLRFWKIGNATIEQIEQTGNIQETFSLFAEESGVVTNRRVSVGDYLKKGEPLFDLINLKKVWVLFDAYEEDLPNISVGNNITFTVASIPNKTFKTRITFIDPMLDSKTRTTALRAEVNNARGLLKPEMFVTGILNNNTFAKSKSQLTIPKSAVLWTGKRSVVYVKVPDTEIPSYRYREVEIGEGIGSNYLIMSGLEVGEEVVVNGSFTIDAAAQLNNQSSMMNKNVTLKKEETGAIPNFQAATPAIFKEQLEDLSNAYLQLKDALVATDASSASTTVKLFITQLKKIDMSLLKGNAHLYWMEQLNALESHGKKIITLADVEAQRKQFGFLSDALINSIEAFGISGTALYVQHCPMAFNNKGGDWLAKEEAIQNPYFGDKMMKCGTVKKSFE